MKAVHISIIDKGKVYVRDTICKIQEVGIRCTYVQDVEGYILHPTFDSVSEYLKPRGNASYGKVDLSKICPECEKIANRALLIKRRLNE